jgi:hypothetical protein
MLWFEKGYDLQVCGKVLRKGFNFQAENTKYRSVTEEGLMILVMSWKHVEENHWLLLDTKRSFLRLQHGM